MAPLEQFRVRNKLFKILETAGATETLFSPKQILSYLGKYIEQKKLHDMKNMRIVRCKGDALEDLFGVEEFVIGSCKEIWNFVFPYIVPATNKEASNGENKPTTSESNEDSHIVTKLEHSWMKQLPWWYFVQKPEEAKTATGSIMDNSTAFVKDTEYSTELSSSIKVLSHDERFSVEFEPDSDSCSESATDSDDTEPVESEEEMTYSTLSIPLTDSSESTVIEDYWECSECPNMNPPIVGYCQRCWKLRKGWLKSSFPDIAPLKSLSLTQNNELDDVPMLPRWSSDPQGVDVTDGKLLKRTRSQDLSQKDMRPYKKPTLERETTLTDVLKTDFASSGPQLTNGTAELPSSSKHPNLLKSNSHSSEQQSAESAAQLSCSNHSKIAQSNCITSSLQSAHESQVPEPCVNNEHNVPKNGFTALPFNKPKPPELPGICNICRDHPNDASFIHGQVGHQYCCYKCALKVLKRDGKCPLCREPIEIVVKNYIYQM